MAKTYRAVAVAVFALSFVVPPSAIANPDAEIYDEYYTGCGPSLQVVGYTTLYCDRARDSFGTTNAPWKHERQTSCATFTVVDTYYENRGGVWVQIDASTFGVCRYSVHTNYYRNCGSALEFVGNEDVDCYGAQASSGTTGLIKQVITTNCFDSLDVRQDWYELCGSTWEPTSDYTHCFC